MLKNKKYLLLLSIYFPVSAAGEVDINWNASLNTDFYSWEIKDKDSYGYQFVTPLNISTTLSMPDLLTINAGVRTAYIDSENRSDGVLGTLGHMSDTSINLAISYDESWIKPWVSLDINVPTGKSKLKGQEKNTLMDPNLVGQTRFGEGWNFSPAIGLVFEVTDYDVISIGGSYNIKGKYVSDGDTGNSLDPGDIYTATLQYQHLAENSFTSIGMVYSNEGVTKLGGIKVFQPGERFDINTSHSQRFLQQHTLSVFFRYSITDNNKRFDPFLGKFSDEERDGAGDVLLTGLSYVYQYDRKLSAGVGFDYLLREANEYQVGNDLFIPNRDKWSMNVFSTYTLTKNLSLSSKIGYFEMRDQKTEFLTAIDYSGITASLGLTFQY